MEFKRNKNLHENYEYLKLGKLQSGENVYDKPESHIHHTVKHEVPGLLPQINAEGKTFVLKTMEVAGKEWPLYRVTVDPTQDKLFLALRKGRKGYSVFVEDREPEVTDKVTIILRKSDDYPDQSMTPVRDGYTVGTAFSGTMAQREPWDDWFNQGKDDEEIAKRKLLQQNAIEYWSTNALVPNEDEFEIIEESKVAFDPELLRNQIIPT